MRTNVSGSSYALTVPRPAISYSLRNSCFLFCRKYYLDTIAGGTHPSWVGHNFQDFAVSRTKKYNFSFFKDRIHYEIILLFLIRFSFTQLLLNYLNSVSPFTPKKILALNDANIIAYSLYLTIYVQQYHKKIRLLKMV